MVAASCARTGRLSASRSAAAATSDGARAETTLMPSMPLAKSEGRAAVARASRASILAWSARRDPTRSLPGAQDAAHDDRLVASSAIRCRRSAGWQLEHVGHLVGDAGHA